MRFLLDENLHAGTGGFLQSLGHDVIRVPPGIKNGEVLALAIAEDRILLTHDKDFLGYKWPPAGRPNPGVICIRIHPPVLERIVQALSRLLKELAEKDLRGGTIALDESGYRKV